MIIRNKIKKAKVKVNSTYRFLKYYFFLSVSLFLIFIFLILKTGYWGNYKKIFLDRLYKSSYNNYMNIPQIIPQIIYGYFINIPEININISFKNQLILEEDRKSVTKIGSGMSYNFNEVPASIQFNKQKHKIDLRLKGDRAIHFNEKDKASYKIELDNNKKILGLNKFSLMKPRARNYIHEWLFHEFMQSGNLIEIKYEFINLKINGEDKGLYVLEEGFDKVVIERNKKRNGPIFALKEEWNSEQNNKSGKEIVFQVYNKKTWLSKENIKLTLSAHNLLKEFFNDNRKLEDVFDIEKWAWYFAASDINYYDHGTLLKSVKFYYNPLSAKFEPIPFDGHRAVVDYNKNILDWSKGYYRNSRASFELAISCNKDIKNCPNPLAHKFFYYKFDKPNKNFFYQYKKNINKITSKKFLDKFFKERKNDILKINAKIYGDYFYVDNTYFFGPGLYYFNKNEVYERGNRLKSKLSSKSFNFLITQSGNRIEIKNWNFLELVQLSDKSLVLEKIYCKNNLLNKELIYRFNQSLDQKSHFIILDNKTNDEIQCNKALIVDKIYKNKFFIKIDPLSSQYVNSTNIPKDAYLEHFYRKGKILRLKKKNTIINRTITIPQNFVVKILQNEEIILINESFIISESSFYIDGGNPKINPPIKIMGKKNNNGGGIFIRNTINENYFHNVAFENLKGNSKNILFDRYILYGAINIYNSKIRIEDFQIKNIFSEDAINIVNSNFLIRNGTIKNILSDAIDVDNGEGSIDSLEIANIKNDAIDFSESNVNISDIYFENIGDKAISAGENSYIEINDILIKESYLGIVSKDGSSVNAKNINTTNVRIPFATYIKKNEYKAPVLKVKNIKYQNYKILYMKDKPSEFTINNNAQKDITINIIDKIYKPEDKI